MLECVFFNLDGTLLPMDMDTFTGGYFSLRAEKLAPLGYEKKKLIDSVWAGTKAMVKNDGSVTNREAFWRVFGSIWGGSLEESEELFDGFYRNEFEKVRSLCGFSEKAAEVVSLLKDAGIGRVLATNPIFPEVATRARVRWAGLSYDDFSIVTTYENTCYAKPDVRYYEYLLEKTGFRAERTLMVGNDCTEDMVAQKCGMKVFLLTPCMINPAGEDIGRWPHGDFDGLISYIRSIM